MNIIIITESKIVDKVRVKGHRPGSKERNKFRVCMNLVLHDNIFTVHHKNQECILYILNFQLYNYYSGIFLKKKRYSDSWCNVMFSSY